MTTQSINEIAEKTSFNISGMTHKGRTRFILEAIQQATQELEKRKVELEMELAKTPCYCLNSVVTVQCSRCKALYGDSAMTTKKGSNDPK